MAVLNNVNVVDADLVAVRADIEDYFLHQSDAGFSDEIAGAKRKLYREIRSLERTKNPSKSEEELATLLDTVEDSAQDEPLKNKIVLLTISDIFVANNMLDLAEAYKRMANDIPVDYTIDTDEEVVNYKPVRLGR